MKKFIQLTRENIKEEHICCAISDKKCTSSYQAKKDWLKGEFANGYVFRRLDARAKVFIEYGPAENTWLPIEAPNYININCFWVSGKHKKQGNAKKLLQFALDDAIDQGKNGLVTVAGTNKKLPFMSDTKWLLGQGFEDVEQLTSGFSLLVKKVHPTAKNPTFKPSVKTGKCEHQQGLVAYYSNRCPFAEYHAMQSLKETAEKRNIPLKVIKIKTLEQAQQGPTPATIFSLFLNGEFITTDISACMDNRFDKVLAKSLSKK